MFVFLFVDATNARTTMLPGETMGQAIHKQAYYGTGGPRELGGPPQQKQWVRPPLLFSFLSQSAPLTTFHSLRYYAHLLLSAARCRL